MSPRAILWGEIKAALAVLTASQQVLGEARIAGDVTADEERRIHAQLLRASHEAMSALRSLSDPPRKEPQDVLLLPPPADGDQRMKDNELCFDDCAIDHEHTKDRLAF